MSAGIASHGAVEELITAHSGHLDVSQDKPAVPGSHQTKGLFWIRGGDGFITHRLHDRGEHFKLVGIVVQNTRSETGSSGGEFNAVGRSVCHSESHRKSCAIRES